MKNWRPENWEEIIKEIKVGLIIYPFLDSERKYLEAGADAMLEAIRKRGYISGASLRKVKDAIGWASIDSNSRWYPIPDEEAKQK